MKVILNNFQILEGRNEFEFNSGITIIVGPNASGKSSLFYAIENCLTNPNGVSDCINFNHNKTEVTIEENGESISWIRTQDSSIYKNNKTGEQYVKASKLDSRNLADLGFYFDDKGRVVNIHNEWSILFPFGESDSEMFRLFEDIFNLSCSFQIIDEMKKDEQNIKSSITEQQKQKIQLEDKLNIIATIEEKVSNETIQNHINILENNLQQTSEMREDYEQYSKNSLLKSIILPELFDVSILYETLHAYESIKNDFEYYQNNKHKAETKLPKVELSLDFESPNILKQEYEQYCVTKASLNDYNNQLNALDLHKQELLSRINKIKICPTCGRPLENI